MDLPKLQNTCQTVCELITQVVQGIDQENLIESVDDAASLQKAGRELTAFLPKLIESDLETPENHETTKMLRHDLRNILGAITGYGEMIDEDTEHLAAFKNITKALLSETKVALKLVEAGTASTNEELTEPSVFEDQREATEATSPTEPQLEPQTPKGQLLVIDDNENNRDLLSHYLSKLGHQVSAVESASSALEAMTSTNFDLILLDLIMPEVDGYQFLKQLKASDQWRAIPVIMVSGIDDTDGVIQCIKAGAEDYLTKPFNPVLLEARLSACLERKRWHDREVSYLDELEKRNRFIRQTFGRYLTDEIVNSLLENPDGLDLGGGYKKVTIVMTDIRNFTNMCESMKPDLVVKMLNNYLGVMTKVIMDYRGTVDEFIGDAILALFGAPIQREDDTDRAVACAIAMQLAMSEVNEMNQRDGLPEIAMGIGINTGEVIAGNIGSDQRLKYAVVGQHVNLAARVESHTTGGQVIASQNTIDAMSTPIKIGKSEAVELKGFREKINIHDVIGIEGKYNLFLDQSSSINPSKNQDA